MIDLEIAATIFFLILIFCAGFGIGYFTPSQSMSPSVDTCGSDGFLPPSFSHPTAFNASQMVMDCVHLARNVQLLKVAIK